LRAEINFSVSTKKKFLPPHLKKPKKPKKKRKLIFPLDQENFPSILPTLLKPQKKIGVDIRVARGN